MWVCASFLSRDPSKGSFIGYGFGRFKAFFYGYSNRVAFGEIFYASWGRVSCECFDFGSLKPSRLGGLWSWFFARGFSFGFVCNPTWFFSFFAERNTSFLYRRVCFDVSFMISGSSWSFSVFLRFGPCFWVEIFVCGWLYVWGD